MSFMITKSGKIFRFDSAVDFDYDIESIAWALAHQCRFNGHIDTFYSVAQHSVLVSYIVPHKDALAGLLHDSAEAFMGDIIRPVKMVFPQISKLEDVIRESIFHHFGLDITLPDSVKYADEKALSTERRDLLSFFPNNPENLRLWNPEKNAPAQALKIHPLTAENSYRVFMDRFHWITKNA